jgi:peptide/nickel transport system substrate-binding protein
MPRVPVLILAFWTYAATFGTSGICQEERIPNLSGVRGGNLIVGLTSDPSNFNRMLVSGLANTAVTERLSADLVHINRSNLKLEPSLATGWEIDQEGRIYTIHLRHGVRFSDSSPLTADDVIFTFQVLTDPKVGCDLAGQIRTGGRFPTISKIDEHTIRLQFEHPAGMGLRMLDSLPILPKHRLWKAYKEGRLASAWGPTVAPDNVVGLGAFRLKEYERGAKVVLERNPYYWKRDRSGQALPYLDTITFLIIPDLNSEVLRFRQGELDLVDSPSLGPEHYAVLRRGANNYVLRDLGPGLAVDFLWFNLNRKNRNRKSGLDPEKLQVFEAPDFRRAISYALDREGMARSVLLGLGVPQYGPISSGNREWYFDRISKTAYDPGYARQLLAKLGLRDVNRDGILEYGNKRNPLDINLLTNRGNGVRDKLAQIVQDNLSKIGIRVGIQYLLPNEIASRFMDSFDYEAILFGFTPTDVAPDLQTDLWYSSGKLHFWCPNQSKPERSWEADVDALMSRFLIELEPGKRRTCFSQVQEIWTRQMPAIATIAPNILVAWSRRLENINPSILAPHLLWNAEQISEKITDPTGSGILNAR